MNVTKTLTIIACVLALGGVSSASHQAYGWAKRCMNVDYYDSHSRWCDTARKVGVVKAVARDNLEVPMSSQVDRVTVTRDFQAADDGGHEADRFIALQTKEDVAGVPSSYGFAQTGWYVSARDLGTKYFARATAAERRLVRTVTRTTRTVTVIAEK